MRKFETDDEVLAIILFGDHVQGGKYPPESGTDERRAWDSVSNIFKVRDISPKDVANNVSAHSASQPDAMALRVPYIHIRDSVLLEYAIYVAHEVLGISLFYDAEMKAQAENELSKFETQDNLRN